MTCRITWKIRRGRRAKCWPKQSSHCLEGAIFAAAALRANGYPPLLLDFEAEHDTDHVIAIYRQDGCWGAVAKSNYTGCRWREPVYRTLRELALSYFNAYFNLRRERTLRRYSVPVNLKRFDRQNWMTTDQPVWFIVVSPVRHQALSADDQGAGKEAASRGRAAVSGRMPGQGLQEAALEKLLWLLSSSSTSTLPMSLVSICLVPAADSQP